MRVQCSSFAGSLRIVTMALVVAACGGPRMTTAIELPTSPRRPDGVTLDPPAAMPDVQDRAPAHGIVALREPSGDEEALKVVRDFTQAFVREDKDTLRGLFADHATQLDAHGAGSAESLRAFFDARLRSFDYSKLVGAEIFRPEQVERSTFEDLGAGAARPRPPEMRAGDILLRVPILTARLGNDRLFADVVVLVLRREEGTLKITGYGEDASP